MDFIKKILVVLLLFLIGCTIAQDNTITGLATGVCPPGMKLGREVFGTAWCGNVCGECVQEKCPTGIGRNNAGSCSCWEKEWNKQYIQTCRKGIAWEKKLFVLAASCGEPCPKQCPEGVKEVAPMGALFGILHECCEDRSCAKSQKCITNKCVEIDCSCGELKDNACKPYECCNDAQCKGTPDQPMICDTSDTEKYPKPEHKCVPGESKCRKVKVLVGQDTVLDMGLATITADDLKAAETKLNIIIISDHYGNKGEEKTNPNKLTKFLHAASENYLTMYSRKPFTTYADKVRFYVVEELGDVGCRYGAYVNDNKFVACSASESKKGDHLCLTYCDHDKIRAAAANCPNSKLPDSTIFFVLTDLDPSRGNALVPVIIAGWSSSANNYGLSHEIGHILSLKDEYIPYGDNNAPEGSSPGPNCDVLPCNSWKDISNMGCIQGCTYRNWYRSRQEGNIMDGLGTEFDIPSQMHLEEALKKYK